MKKNYLLSETNSKYSRKHFFNAGNKARIDVETICRNQGIKLIPYYVYNGNKCYKVWSYFKQNISFLWKLKNDVVFIQYPCVSHLNLLLLISILKIKHCKIILVIHDIFSLRESSKLAKIEKKIFNTCNTLIVHTMNMKKVLCEYGIHSEFKILEFFDYLTSTSGSIDYEDNSIIFAGNLEKSIFIKDLYQYPLTFNLYGAKIHKEVLSHNVNYKGKFSPENLTSLKGKWGLVWDGNSCKTCSSIIGEYLKINAPHKFSMYIAAGIPVIVWKQSALYPLVVKLNIGIGVNSIGDIKQAINNLQDYNKIVDNVKNISSKIKNGEMLKQIIKKSI